jgi:hypothetical protein
MNKLGVRLLLLLGLTGSVQVFARELRTPYIWQQNSIFRDGYYHYPLPRPKEDETCWNYDVWGGGYARFADKAFRNKDGRGREPLDAIFFGKADFTASEIFAPGTAFVLNPFLSFATLSPRFNYNEKGAYFGFTLDRGFGCDDEWHVGLRARLPVRSIEVENDNNDIQVDQLEDVFRTNREFIFAPDAVDSAHAPETTQVIEDSFAIRFDFLSSLPLTNNAPQEPLVNFGVPLRINQINVGDQLPIPGNPNKAPVHVIKNAAGNVPDLPFSRINQNVSGLLPAGDPGFLAVNQLPFLNGDGSGLTSDGNRARFNETTSYAALKANKVAQRQLWVVGTDETQPLAPAIGDANETDMMNNARSIQTAIQSILKGIETDVIDFFDDKGISFASQNIQGAGDLDLDLYVARQFCKWNGQAALGMRFPTGGRITNPGKLLAQPLGNNGHYELRGALFAGWEPTYWVALSADVSYNWVLKRTENVAAAFKGATVKNIGPSVKADVSWQYFVGNFDVTFLHPCNNQLGFDVGYEPYVKRADKVHFLTSTAEDLLGNVQPLDDSVLENRTSVVAHKIRAEIFHQWDYFEIFAGWAQVVAGKNAPHDTDWHLGAVVYF